MDKVALVKTLISVSPKLECELDYKSNYQLLVAVILSAQCTDKRVNKVTKRLFAVAPDTDSMLSLGEDGLKQIIKSCGFFNNKAKNIMLMTRDLVERFNGVVPDTEDELLSLAGVGEKTAGVVMAVGFGKPAFPVDTHVFRLSKRLGLADEKTPTLTMKALMREIPKELWIDAHHALIIHGRYVCKAIKPDCKNCKINGICPNFNKGNC